MRLRPAGAAFVSATPSQGSCSGTATVICNLGTINNGASAAITLVVEPTAAGPLSNTASVTATSPDPNPTNDSSTTIVQVQPAPATTAIPALDGKTLMLLSALLAGLGIWIVGRKS